MAPFSVILYRSWILTCCPQSSRSSSSLRENVAARRMLTQWQKRETRIILLERHSLETREIKVILFRWFNEANGMETRPTVIKPNQCGWCCVYQLLKSWLQEGSSYHMFLVFSVFIHPIHFTLFTMLSALFYRMMGKQWYITFPYFSVCAV